MSQRGVGRLPGKVAIVAGAGSHGEGAGIGNGRATAVLFAREGARVVIVDINPAAAEVTAELIIAEGGAVRDVTADVAREADCAASPSGRWTRGASLTCCTITWAAPRSATSRLPDEPSGTA